MKKLFGTMAVAAALFAGYSAYNTQNSNELSGIILANVEALASSDEINTPYCATDESYTNICNYYDNAHPCPCGF